MLKKLILMTVALFAAHSQAETLECHYKKDNVTEVIVCPNFVKDSSCARAQTDSSGRDSWGQTFYWITDGSIHFEYTKNEETRHTNIKPGTEYSFTYIGETNPFSIVCALNP